MFFVRLLSSQIGLELGVRLSAICIYVPRNRKDPSNPVPDAIGTCAGGEFFRFGGDFFGLPEALIVELLFSQIGSGSGLGLFISKG